MIERTISGGQTGADQGGLRAAKTLGIPTGGWAPRGRMTEDGSAEELLRSFGLREFSQPGYPPRTRANVDAGIGDVLKYLSGDLMLLCAAHYRRWFVFVTST